MTFSELAILWLARSGMGEVGSIIGWHEPGQDARTTGQKKILHWLISSACKTNYVMVMVIIPLEPNCRLTYVKVPILYNCNG